jgi:hypothetical protein
MSFDNLAFLLQDIGYDMRQAARLLVAQSQGEIAPSHERLRYTMRMLRAASKHIGAAAEHLETIVGDGDDTD